MKFALVALSLGALLPVQAIGAEPATSAAQSPETTAVAAAMRMLEAQDFDAQILATTDMMIEGMLAAQTEELQKRAEEPLPSGLLTSFRDTMREHASSTMKAKMPSIKRQSAEIYAREFTVAELNRMTEIAGDPVMVKTRAKGQALSAQLMLVGMNAMRESQDELKQKLEQVVRDHVEKAGLETSDKS